MNHSFKASFLRDQIKPEKYDMKIVGDFIVSTINRDLRAVIRLFNGTRYAGKFYSGFVVEIINKKIGAVDNRYFDFADFILAGTETFDSVTIKQEQEFRSDFIFWKKDHNSAFDERMKASEASIENMMKEIKLYISVFH